MAEWTGSALKSAKGTLAGSFGGVLNAGFGIIDATQRIKAGENPFSSILSAGAAVAISASMGFLPGMAVQVGFSLARAGAEAAYKFNQQQTVYMRQVRQPFSHSFTHTDATHAAQQRGMQALGQGRGFVGSEAGVMARLYARR